MTCIYLGLAIVFIYILIMIIKTKSIPTSVSETWYLGGKTWFTITMFISSILLMIGMLDVTEGSPYQFLSFIVPAGMALVGAAPLFHDFEKTVHYIGAFTLLLGSQIWLCIFSSPWILLVWLLAVFYIKRPDRMFWFEITVFITMILGLIVK